MSYVTVSTQRNRVYTRKFSHEEAIARYKAGEKNISALAREYGVTYAAIKRVIDPETREKMRQHTIRALMRGTCMDCGKEGISSKAERCVPCSHKAQRTNVREDILKCSTCQEWLPDQSFCRNRKEEWRRGRHTQCRKCSTRARISYRERNKVPCEGGCGRMVEGKGRAQTRGDPNRPHLCRTCWQIQVGSGTELNRLYVQLPDLGHNNSAA